MAEKFEGGRAIVVGALLTALCAGVALAGTPGIRSIGPKPDDPSIGCGALVAPGGQPGDPAAIGPKPDDPAHPGMRAVSPNAIGPKPDDPYQRGLHAIGPKPDDPFQRGLHAIGPKPDDPLNHCNARSTVAPGGTPVGLQGG